jgi:hypothetical protein
VGEADATSPVACSQRLEARRATSVYDSPREAPARKLLFGTALLKKKKKMTARGAAHGADGGGVSKTVHLTSYAQRDSDFESVSDGQRRPDDIESVGSSSSDGPVEGDNDLALRSARKVGLGHSVWVETVGRGGPRQLSANLHWLPLAELSAPASPAFEDETASQSSQSRPLRAPGRRSDGLSLSFRSPAAITHRPVSLAPERPERGGRLSFIDSFPTGPTMTRSHGVLYVLVPGRLIVDVACSSSDGRTILRTAATPTTSACHLPRSTSSPSLHCSTCRTLSIPSPRCSQQMYSFIAVVAPSECSFHRMIPLSCVFHE